MPLSRFAFISAAAMTLSCGGSHGHEGPAFLTTVSMRDGGISCDLYLLVEPETTPPVSVVGAGMFGRDFLIGPSIVDGDTSRVTAFSQELSERSFEELEDISCDSNCPARECVNPRLSVLREEFEDFFRFKDVDEDDAAFDFVRESIGALVEYYQTGIPETDEDVMLLESGEWPLPTVPERYR